MFKANKCQQRCIPAHVLQLVGVASTCPIHCGLGRFRRLGVSTVAAGKCLVRSPSASTWSASHNQTVTSVFEDECHNCI